MMSSNVAGWVAAPKLMASKDLINDIIEKKYHRS